MILDDKKRIIGKVISINSDRFTVELLSGTKNFNVNGYDDVHYFAQINSYVIIPYQNHHIVTEVVSVKEKDSPDFSNAREQELNKVYSTKHLEVIPIGTIKNKKFNFGVSVYPSLYSDVLYIKDDELDSIFDVRDHESIKCEKCNEKDSCCLKHKDLYKDKTRLVAIDVGKSAIFPDYKVKINIDKFFGSHSAILGNTGSGKSCTISSMFQTLFKKIDLSSIGASLFIFDVNGEYKNAFSDLQNADISVVNLSIDPDDDKEHKPFTLPHHFFNLDEWELLFQASEKTQRPILRRALAMVTLFNKDNSELETKVRNHILAMCVSSILTDETSSPSKSDRITSILKKFHTEDIKLKKEFSYSDSGKKFKTTVEECLEINFGKMKATEALLKYLEEGDSDNPTSFLKKDFEMPSYDKDVSFDFSELEDALDLAILFEEAHGNKQIRDYCSSLMTRFKSINERDDYNFIKSKSDIKKEDYLNGLLGVNNKRKTSQVTILNLNSIEDELIELTSSVLIRIMFERLRSSKIRNHFPINVILEEAHRYISNDSQRNFLRANQIFERVAKEGRKYGIFLLISSQRPSELSRTVLSQCNNFIVHRIQNPDDLSHIRQITPHISETTLKKLPSIPTQHALIFGSAVNIPTLYKVSDAYPLPLSENNKVSENWFIDKDEIINI